MNNAEYKMAIAGIFEICFRKLQHKYFAMTSIKIPNLINFQNVDIGMEESKGKIDLSIQVRYNKAVVQKQNSDGKNDT